MSPRLDPDEVDALMEDFQASGLAPRLVEPRNFALPRRLSVEDLNEARRRILRGLPEMELGISKLLRRKTALELGAITELHAGELFRDTQSLLGLTRFQSRGQVGWLSLPSPAAVEAVERILGRVRARGDGPSAARPLTPLELGLLVKLVRGLLLQVGNALGIEVANLEGVPTLREAGSYLDAEGRPDPYRLSIELIASAPDGPFAFHILLPVENGKRFVQAQAEAPSGRVPTHLSAVPVELSVHLGQAELSLADMLGLVPGDVIPLDLSRGEPARLCIDGRQVGRGELGAVAGRLALRLTQLELKAEP
jgi:flagellar motor switch protein FliN